MEQIHIFDVLTERDAVQKQRWQYGQKLTELRQELHNLDETLNSLATQAKSEAMLLPQPQISNAEKLKLATEVLLSKMPETQHLRARKSECEQEKMMAEFQFYQAKDEIETLSQKITVWEIQQRHEIALTEERTAERQFDIQRFRSKFYQ